MTRTRISSKQMNRAVGPCLKCGAKEHWYNNVPLTAYCYGSETHPHCEVSKVVPSPYQIYGNTLGPTYWRYSNGRRVTTVPQKRPKCSKMRA